MPEPKTKSSFGTVKINNFSPALPDTVPLGINVQITYEEALKLHIGLQRLLLKMDSYNRNDKRAKELGVCLCIFRDVHSLTVTEQKLGQRKPASAAKPVDDLDQLLKDYVVDVEAANLEPNTKATYLLHARNFVRWARGQFKPGSRKPEA
ncbi:MAG TPA: hypothetical protein VHE55_12630 [Fimbriimonadaceae bacterium]|nr:hypothetical protein [Fimbriimonadaceae bacterium]